MKSRTVKTLIVTTALGSSLLMLSGTAAAHDSVGLSLSIGVPGVVYGPAYAPVYAPPPQVVYAPRPVYYPAPVYYSTGGYSTGGYYSGNRWENRHQREWQHREWRERHHGRGWGRDD